MTYVVHVSIYLVFSFLYFVFAGVPLYDIKFNTKIDDGAITSEGKRNWKGEFL